ncbi:MAG: DUF4174 domain-containing protein [Litoreibacter sp.]|nr:DUF4174 domain-containing protein [Litoreibacter sp.]
MSRRLFITFGALLAANVAGATLAQDSDATVESDMAPQAMGDANLNDFLWEKRPIVVFADTARDPAFIRQLELLEDRPEALAERDVVILTDTDPNELSDLREKLRPRGFMLVLIGKDGDVKLRKPFPWSVRELSRAIDKMPMRQQEIRDRRADGVGSSG